MDLFSFLTGKKEEKGVLEQISKESGTSLDQVEALASLALPALLEQMNRNTKDEKERASLAKALDDHASSTMDDLAGFLKGVDKDDGSKILGHIFKDKNESVQKDLAKGVGISDKQVGLIMSMLAPMVLGSLGKQKKKEKVETNNLSDLTGQVLKSMGSNKGLMAMAMKVLDPGGGKEESVGLDIGRLLGKLLK